MFGVVRTVVEEKESLLLVARSVGVKSGLAVVFSTYGLGYFLK